MESMLECAFYSVCDSRHFPGAVALLNSLRLVGHDEPIFLVDAGLTAEQRSRIAEHVTLIAAPEGVPVFRLPPFGPSRQPARVAVLIDADIIVVRPLTRLMDAARDGRLVGFINNQPNHDRFFPEWSTMLGLGPVRRQPYLNAGQLLIPDALSRRLLEPWHEGLAKVDPQRTWLQKGCLSDPFYFGDQDVINAILGAHLEPHEITTLEHRLAPHPPFSALRLIDRNSLLCRYPDGASPFFLHHVLAKPWLTPTRLNVYASLLPRLLLAPDVALRLEPQELPLRLREGWLATLDRGRAHAQALVTALAIEQFGRFGIRTRVRRRLTAQGRKRAVVFGRQPPRSITRRRGRRSRTTRTR
jgi:hypothetical protein